MEAVLGAQVQTQKSQQLWGALKQDAGAPRGRVWVEEREAVGAGRLRAPEGWGCQGHTGQGLDEGQPLVQGRCMA